MSAGFANAATIYNAVDGFSNVNGGASVWSYGYNASNAADTAAKLDTYLTGIFGGQVNAWHNSDGSCCGQGTNDNSVLIGKDIGAAPAVYETIVQPHDYLSQDPESYASADLVFTTKLAGTYKVDFGFLGIDTGEHSHGVDVRYNGGLVQGQGGTIDTFGSQFNSSFTIKLAAGDTLDFQTLGGPDFTNLSTGVQANIALSAVPLPASAPLFGAALLALGAVGYGVKRKQRAAQA